MMLTLVLGTAVAFTSCGDDDKDEVNNTIIIPQDPIVDGINAALIPGMYEFNGNIAPSFILYRDGTCDIQNNGLSGDITKDKWSYEKTTHILMVGTHVYNVKLLTKDKLAAEWTSVKYGTSLSSWKRTELPKEGDPNGHEYVDLGLSVKWATCNIGASSPSHYGSYYAWGETTTKSKYYDTNYTYSDAWPLTLPLDKDAARVNWGGDWRIPTKEEFSELRYSCTWTWTTLNGSNGYKVTSNINGKSIFLPAAGYYDSTYKTAGATGNYWSSSRYESLYDMLPKEVHELYFTQNSILYDHIVIRYEGHSIRPVLKK